MDQRIKCPECGEKFEISQAMTDQVAAVVKGEMEAEFSAKERKLLTQRRQLDQQRKEVEALQEEFHQRVNDAVRQQRAKVLAKAREEARQAVEVEIQDQDAQLKDALQRLKRAQEEELSLRKKQHQLVQR